MKKNKIFLLLLASFIIILTVGNAWAQTDDANNLAGVIDSVITTEYTVAYSKDGETFVITNSKEVDTVNVTAEKIWDDADNQDALRPTSIFFQLKADGVATGDPVEVSPDTNGKWAANWINLPKNNAGTPIKYTVEEVNLSDDYTSSYDAEGLTVTNSHTPITQIIKINVGWEDENDNDGMRPTEVTITVTKPDGSTEDITTSVDEDFKAEIELPKYTPGKVGVIAEYSYKLNVPSSYFSDPVGPTSATEVDVLGVHIPERVNVVVNTVWNDQSNRDGIRPVDVDLKLSNGVDDPVTAQTSGSGDNWTYTFPLQYKYRNGELVTFTLESENLEPDYLTTVNKDSDYQFTVTNNHETAVSPYTVNVEWHDENNRDGIRPESVNVKVMLGNEVVETVTLDKDHNYSTVVNLNEYVEGKQGEPAKYTYVFENLIDSYVGTSFGPSPEKTATLHAEYHPELIDVDVTVVWDDNNNRDGLRPNVSEVTLTDSDTNEYKHSISGIGNRWSYIYKNLKKYATSTDASSPAILNVFNVTQNDLGDEYTTTIEKVTDKSFVITNKHTPKTSEKTVNVVWDDDNDRDGLRPETVTVDVKVGNKTITQVVLNKSENYTKKVELPIYEEGKTGVVAQYTYDFSDLRSEYTGTGFGPSSEDVATLNASYNPENAEINVTVVWDDGNNQDRIRPNSVDVTVTDTDQNTETKAASGAGNSWNLKFNSFKRYASTPEDQEAMLNQFIASQSSAGDQYTTTVEKVDDYNFVIKNVHKPNTVSRTVTIIWDDDNNRDGIRPENLTASVIANGAPNGDKCTVNVDGEWKCTFDELDENIAGNPINYRVQILESVGGYVYEVSEDGWTITYKHTPATSTYSGTLVWDDNNDNDRVRPESVTFELYANDVPTGQTQTVTDNNQTVTWKDLIKNQDGEPIIYTVRMVEDLSENYVTSYDDSETKTIVKNTHAAEQQSLYYEVVWDDANNQDGYRPATVFITVNGDNGSTRRIDVDASIDHLEDSIEDLPAKKDGKLIIYTADMTTVPNKYELDVTRKTDGRGTYVFTLTHIPEKTHLFTVVEWDDQDDIDGIRPDDCNICIRKVEKGSGLLGAANGNYEGALESANVPIYGSYAYDFRQLDKKEEGELIDYEAYLCDGVPEGYALSPDSTKTRIILVHAPEKEPGDKINKTVRKEWDDNDDFYEVRPETVTVQLYGDGQKIGDPVEVGKDAYGRWTHTYTDLPSRNSYGNKINYYVRENRVSSYEMPYYTRDGFTIVNQVNENTQYDDPVKRVDVKKSASNSEKKCVLNDTIEIRLWVQNTGKTGLHNVTVRDYMLESFDYQKGSLHISNEDPADTVEEVTEEGAVVRIDANISYLPVNGQRVISYKIRVADPSKVTAEPALFDYGNDEPLTSSDPDPKHWSNRVAPCIPERIPDPVPVARVEVLPKTGFAPNVVTVLPEMNVRYSTYNSLRLRIPSLNVDAEILGVPAAGNGGYDVTWLGENVGWLQDTAMPGSTDPGNTVITGHLTNSYGNPGVFANLQFMKYGDKIILEAWGSKYTYTVDEVTTVYADTPQVLSQRTQKPELSLLTCKYYNEQTGQYDGRVVVKAKLEAID